MKKVFVFEHVVYRGSVEKELYYFCLRKQLSLIKYFFTYFFSSILHFFKGVSKKKYYEKRLSFLKDVRDVEGTIERFWKSRNKKLSSIASDKERIWISEYPVVLLSKLAEQHGAELIANEYDILTGQFLNFKDVYHLYDEKLQGDNTQVYDQYHSKLKKVSSANFNIVHNNRSYISSGGYWFYRVLSITYTYFMLLAMGVCLGVISMYFGAAQYIMPMFLSYFKVDYLPLLNIFPVVLCIFLFYFVFNRVWVSFLITSILTMGLTWINYFKLLIRNDPLLAADINLLFESMDMAGRYEMELNWKITAVIIACLLGTVYAFFFIKGKIQLLRVRLLGVLVLVMVGIYSFNHYYINEELYAATKNFDLINRWSSTQLYISKGFVYPFIYSFKTAIDVKPEGYNKRVAEEIINDYERSDIPNAQKVNVISIMLESYNDFSKFKQIEFTEDVYKHYHQIKEEGYSGELVTNIFAGGTVDTERSFITGYTSLANFRSTVNSYVHYFKGQGYTVEGSHPGYEWFYNRKNMNEYFGFENYYFYENHYSELADSQIAGDNILFPEMIKFYEKNKKTGKPYFSFNVTYQNHGPYSTEALTDVQYIKNKGYSEEEYNILNNYFKGIASTNEQLKLFIDFFRKEEEPVVIILFGDHNPWLGDNSIVYKSVGISLDVSKEEGFYNYYNTPYVIWGNDSAKKALQSDLKGAGPTIGPYFLMNEFFELAGYEGNEFMKYSNEFKEDIDVVHRTGRYEEFGNLTSILSPESKQKLNEFLHVQHYWKKNFND
ncbi:LTA synthase family protein [Fredinandcohnia onubensis]|uniref:LTA synthase family protein n=1 Tax=Fredinandcohnia onubensis TaxID=1571209 RepID=UPI000C0BC153|nr:LTA synthase family protein [Fredinandcohnia onubensis]